MNMLYVFFALVLAGVVTCTWVFVHAVTWLRDARRLLREHYRARLFRQSLEHDRIEAMRLAFWSGLGGVFYIYLSVMLLKEIL